MYKNISKTMLFCIVFFFLSHPSFAKQQLIIEPDMGRAPILNAIQQAKSSIELVMYGFTDPQFATALINANAKNKNVKVLLQQYPYKAEAENKKTIGYLQTAHVPLQWPSAAFKLIHQKSLLIDDNTALIMTFNLTHSSFSKERNFALVITDPNVVREMHTVFQADWQHQPATVHNADLIWSPDNSREKLLSLIRNAKAEIKIYAEGLNDYQIVGSLAKAARSGVKVTVLTSTFDNKPVSKKFLYLAKNGVTIRYSKDYVIHAKVILIDQKQAVLGSVNLTRQSLDGNRELAIITQDQAIIQQLSRTFERDCQHATTAVSAPDTKALEPYALLKGVKLLIAMAKKYNPYPRQHKQHSHPNGAKLRKSNYSIVWTSPGE